MLQSVRKIQEAGLIVSGGFIVGFDSDTLQDLKFISDFIQRSGIIWSMVGLLNAPQNTNLYQRLNEEGRLIGESSGNNTDYSLNFVPKMDVELLKNGYNGIIYDIYSIQPYYKRLRWFIKNWQQANYQQIKTDRYYISGFIKSVYYLGIVNKGQLEFWKFLFWLLMKKRQLILPGIMFAITGYHFRKVYGIG